MIQFFLCIHYYKIDGNGKLLDEKMPQKLKNLKPQFNFPCEKKIEKLLAIYIKLNLPSLKKIMKKWKFLKKVFFLKRKNTYGLKSIKRYNIAD